MQSPTHRSGAYTWPAQLGPEHRRCHLAATGSHSPTSSLGVVTDAPGCEAKALAQSTTYACDTVNLPEFSIMYLFWVLTLCTETAAHDCFFREKKKEKKKNSGKRRYFILCTFWFFAMLACVLLREQGPSALGTCTPVAQPLQLKIRL
uniref:Uncharacterized protein n=1 Tax=Molossus molossus TaxID=27622 RepID=A0A7J8I9V7_MOLMO|nr:hypothetical protein HJG59_010653 [Molossus molossus]